MTVSGGGRVSFDKETDQQRLADRFVVGCDSYTLAQKFTTGTNGSLGLRASNDCRDTPEHS